MGRRGAVRFRVVCSLCLAFTFLPARAAPPPAVPPEQIEPLLDTIVAALHEGDYPGARQRLDEAYALSPSDPGVLWAHAFLLVWQGAYRLGDVAGDAAFAGLLDAIQAHFDELKSGDPREGRAAYYDGLAALMRARTRVEGRERELFKAVSDARRGMRSLERAVERGYDVPDASFWTGAYRVMAHSLPAALRALRLLIGMPSASLKKGMSELEQAAAEGRRFRLEASLLLAATLAEDRKQGYGPALAEFGTVLPALSTHGSVLPHYAGELLAEWGLSRQAVSLWEEILERHARRPELYGRLEMAVVRYDLARVLFGEYRWADAIRHLQIAAEDPDPALSERARLLLARCHQRMGNRLEVARSLEQFSGSEKARERMLHLMVAPFPDLDQELEVSRALERWRDEGAAAALSALESFLSRHPSHAVGRYHAGRAAFELRQAERAARHFQRLLELDRQSGLPESLLGWVHLYEGWLADLSGARQEALAHYEQVQKLESFDAYRAGSLYAELPYDRAPSREVDVWALLGEAGSRRGWDQPRRVP